MDNHPKVKIIIGKSYFFVNLESDRFTVNLRDLRLWEGCTHEEMLRQARQFADLVSKCLSCPVVEVID